MRQRASNMDDDRILVTGGTGTLGRHLVPRLRETGREIRVLSRRGQAWIRASCESR